MSYDLEVRSDDSYSRFEARERVIDMLRRAGARMGESATYMVYDDAAKGHKIEIDLGHEGAGAAGSINFLGFGVPYAFLNVTGPKVIELAFSTASHLGWRVYDPQAGRYFDSGEEAAALAAQGQTIQAVEQVGTSEVLAPRLFLARVIDRLIRQTKFMILIAVVAFGTIAAYAATAPQGQDPRRVVGIVLVTAGVAILLRPVILELIESRRA